MSKEQIILGIDPGTIVTGYGVLLQQNNELKLLNLGVIQLKKYDSHAVRLRIIFQETLDLINRYNPDSMALEDPFYGKNIQVMLKLGRVQGVAMAAALSMDIPIAEYSPRKIKQSITGNGNASKEQVAAMLKYLLNFDNTPHFLDATDGLAVAVTHAFQRTNCTQTKYYSGWDTFLKENPDRKL